MHSDKVFAKKLPRPRMLNASGTDWWGKFIFIQRGWGVDFKELRNTPR